ncbi:hypothetical protein GGR55DRAFT_663385 [Xylaria sp. FL0064]|nr:hypothetical protein GGR55DRAFT_663385 [Xylaria sp. FL0064]
MEFKAAERRLSLGEPIEIDTKLVTLEHLIHCLRKLLGSEKFTIEMRHDVYKIKSGKSIDAQDLIAQCQPGSPNRDRESGTVNSNTKVDGSETQACDTDRVEFQNVSGRIRRYETEDALMALVSEKNVC